MRNGRCLLVVVWFLSVGLPVHFLSGQRVSVEASAGHDWMLNRVEEAEDGGLSLHIRAAFLATDRLELGVAYGLTRGERPRRGCGTTGEGASATDCRIGQDEFQVYLVDARVWPVGRSTRGAGPRPFVGVSTGVVNHRTFDGVDNGVPIGLEGGLAVRLVGGVHVLTAIEAQALSLDKSEFPRLEMDGFGVRFGLRTGLAIHF